MLYLVLIVLFVSVFGFLAWHIVIRARSAHPAAETYECPHCNEQDCICHKSDNPEPWRETMSDLMDLIQSRRSCRKYEALPIPDAKLEQVLEALRWAPSWANTQCWEVVVVRDAAVKEALQACLPDAGNPALKAMVQAPVVLVLCAQAGRSGYYKEQAGTQFGDWMLYDLGLATQNICLMAHSLGLGTVVVGLFDHRKAAGVLNLPPGYELVSMIPMGYPARISAAPKRREIAEFIHHDRW